MIAIFSLLITLVLSLLVTRFGAMALMLTGLSNEASKFQARSAFCGVGYTSDETESIMSHPVRRRIVYWLMLAGNIGLATFTASTIASLLLASGSRSNEIAFRMGILAAGVVTLWIFSRSRIVERQLNRAISWALRRFARLEVRDYISILNLQKGYSVFELHLCKKDWLAEKSLRELRLTREGILILGIRRKNGEFLGAPKAETKTAKDDILVLYGPIDRLTELDRREAGRRGDKAHLQAVRAHEIEKEQQDEIDPESTTINEMHKEKEKVEESVI